MFPIGVGSQYDRAQLDGLSGYGMQDNAMHLSNMEDLQVMAALGHTFIDKLCRGEGTQGTSVPRQRGCS